MIANTIRTEERKGREHRLICNRPSLQIANMQLLGQWSSSRCCNIALGVSPVVDGRRRSRQLYHGQHGRSIDSLEVGTVPGGLSGG